MSGWAVEFEFVEDAAGNGQFVAAGGGVPRLLGLVRQGQIEQAAQAYEEMGRSAAAALLEEARVSSINTRKHIAEIFKRARDFAGGAHVLEQLGQHGEAAQLFERAGEFAAAARCHLAGGEAAQAAQAFERAGKLDDALALYEKHDDPAAAAACLVRMRRFFDAASIYRKLGNLHAEVEMLRQVPASDARYLEAVEQLGLLMEQHGHLARAAQLLIGVLGANPQARQQSGLQGLLLRCLDQLGRHAEADQVRASFGLPAGSPLPAPRPSTRPGPAPAADLRDSDSHDYAYLKAIPIFGELALDDMRDLFRVATHAEFPAGSALIEQGAPARGLVVITEGQVEVAARVDGQMRPLNTLSAGAYVGEIGLVQAGNASARVTAQTAVRALFISNDAFAHYVYEHPAAALAIYRLFTQNLAERVRVLTDQRG